MQRARRVCQRCHRRKIRCDLQSVADESCTACTRSESACVLRHSNQGRRIRRNSELRVSQPPTSQDELVDQSSVVAQSIPSHPSQQTQRATPIDWGDSTVELQLDIRAFFSNCYWFCPVFDTLPLQFDHNGLVPSLLVKALRLLSRQDGTMVELEMQVRNELYSHLTQLHDRVCTLQAALLLSISGSTVDSSINTTFVLLGVAIRLAQSAGLHLLKSQITEQACIQRRIWWALFTRERFMAICQGLPHSIDLDFSSIEPPNLQDFPANRDREAQLFIHHVKLADIVGRINKKLVVSRRTGEDLASLEIAGWLVSWLSALPAQLQMPLHENGTNIDRDIGLLHLPYLNAISLVYLYTSEEQLPQASIASVLAAAFTARIFEDLQRQDRLGILPEEAGWYAATAAIALMHVTPLRMLTQYAASSIEVLQSVLEALSKRWSSSKALHNRIARAMLSRSMHNLANIGAPTNGTSMRLKAIPTQLDDLCSGDNVSWPEFFPFASTQSSPLVAVILEECQSTFPQLWAATIPGGFDGFLQGFQGSTGI